MRKDFLLLNQRIKDAYREYIKEHKQIPTQTQVAEICGVTQVTISKHFTKIDLSELVSPFKIFGDDILMGLRGKAMKGDAQAAKLFFMLVYDWQEKTELKHTGDIKLEYTPAKYKDDEDD
jgi:transcription initiation factor TFIIIB Brf1 subunit/transcription initiation factor TFIIB